MKNWLVRERKKIFRRKNLRKSFTLQGRRFRAGKTIRRSSRWICWLDMLAAICRELEKTPNDLIETESGRSLRFYKSLSFGEKYGLALEWRGEHKLTCFLAVVYNLILCAGVGIISYFSVAQRFMSYPLSFFVICISGAALLVAAGSFLYIFTIINNTVKYNNWLLQKKSIIRKCK